MFYIDVTQINKLINNQRLKKQKRQKICKEYQRIEKTWIEGSDQY